MAWKTASGGCLGKFMCQSVAIPSCIRVSVGGRPERPSLCPNWGGLSASWWEWGRSDGSTARLRRGIAAHNPPPPPTGPSPPPTTGCRRRRGARSDLWRPIPSPRRPSDAESREARSDLTRHPPPRRSDGAWPASRTGRPAPRPCIATLPAPVMDGRPVPLGVSRQSSYVRGGTVGQGWPKAIAQRRDRRERP